MAGAYETLGETTKVSTQLDQYQENSPSVSKSRKSVENVSYKSRKSA